MNEDIDPETLREQDAGKMIPPLHGALIKNEQDVHLFERLAGASRKKLERLNGSEPYVRQFFSRIEVG